MVIGEGAGVLLLEELEHAKVSFDFAQANNRAREILYFKYDSSSISCYCSEEVQLYMQSFLGEASYSMHTIQPIQTLMVEFVFVK